MDMPITVEIVDAVNPSIVNAVYAYFSSIDRRFSTFRDDSEITAINSGRLRPESASEDMKHILFLSQKTKEETSGYFDINRNGKMDPSGLVKGWAIWQAAHMLHDAGCNNFYIDAGGDIQVAVMSSSQKQWTVGIRNPFNTKQIVKRIKISEKGIATSGTYERGMHVYNPKSGSKVDDIVSLTVIGPNVYEADRFATAAFAMGKKGIEFIETLTGFEGYMIGTDGIALYTSGFARYIV